MDRSRPALGQSDGIRLPHKPPGTTDMPPETQDLPWVQTREDCLLSKLGLWPNGGPKQAMSLLLEFRRY